MADRKIDYDRGVLKNVHPTGLDVYMYIDSPGIYLTAFETPVTEVLARQAGFDTERLGKERVRRERMVAAQQAIDQELNTVQGMKTVVQERKGFKVMDIGLGRFQVFDPDDNLLNKQPVTEEQAKGLLAELTKEA